VTWRSLVGAFADEFVDSAETTTRLGSAAWKNFARNTDGEWWGVSATFDSEGVAKPLPERFISDAYREWGFDVLDWKTQCSVQATDEGLRYKQRKLFSGTGCEADSIASTKEQWKLRTSQERIGEDKTITPTGCYSVGPLTIAEGESTVEIETCLTPGKQSGGQHYRVRTVHGFVLVGNEWRMQSVEVHKELYDGPFQDGLDVEGFNAGLASYASGPRLTSEELSGVWTICQQYAYGLADSGSITLLSSGGPVGRRDGADADDDTSGIVFLPEGVWTRTRSKDGDSLSLTVGWLHAEGHQIVFQRDYVDRQLESVVFNSEDQHPGNN